MAKKRKLNSGAAQASPSANQSTDASSGGCTVTDEEMALAVRAAQTLASEDSAHEALLEAIQPLVSARAAKYEEDAKATKLQIAAGKVDPRKPLAQAGGSSAPIGEVDALEDEEIGDAVKALTAIAARPEELLSKACKLLRTALHPLVEAQLREQKASPAFQITSMLSLRSRWPEALKVLARLRSKDVSTRPKLGAYQRWIRELNVTEGDKQQLAMLDAIMRVATGLPPGTKQPPTEGASRILPAFDPVPRTTVTNQGVSATAAPATEPISKSAPEAKEGEEPAPISTINMLASLIATRRDENARAKAELGPASWSVICHEVAHERTPPNRFDLDIYTCAPDVLLFDEPPSNTVRQHPLPGVEGAFVLSDVFSSSECDQIRLASEKIGYRPDVPLTSALDERAANVVLFATEQQNDTLFSRVKDSLPQQMDGHQLFGINRRWRLYRYQEGNLYRKHLDGAWPASGVREGPRGKAEYVYDAYGGSTRSKLTFILYLNDDFEGGETTFVVPRPSEEGTLESRPVRPRIGFASVFPHGECPAPLLHEGSSVKKGCKYLLRTDVIYVSPKSLESEKEAARIRGLARQIGFMAKLGGSGGATGAGADGEGDGKKKKVIKRNSKGKWRQDGGNEESVREGDEENRSGKKRKFNAKRTAAGDAGGEMAKPKKGMRADGSKKCKQGEKRSRRGVGLLNNNSATRNNKAKQGMAWRK